MATLSSPLGAKEDDLGLYVPKRKIEDVADALRGSGFYGRGRSPLGQSPAVKSFGIGGLDARIYPNLVCELGYSDPGETLQGDKFEPIGSGRFLRPYATRGYTE